MIKAITKGNRTGSYELQVKVIISQLPFWSTDIEGAKRVFNDGLGKIKRASVATADMFYKASEIKDKSFEVWHLKINGDQDRLVAIVSEI